MGCIEAKTDERPILSGQTSDTVNCVIQNIHQQRSQVCFISQDFGIQADDRLKIGTDLPAGFSGIHQNRVNQRIVTVYFFYGLRILIQQLTDKCRCMAQLSLLEKSLDHRQMMAVIMPDPAEDRCGIVSFNFVGQSSLLVGRYLDAQGINVRSGTHCAQPLLAYLGVGSACRISLAPYNTADDVDCIIRALKGGPEMIARTVLRRTK